MTEHYELQGIEVGTDLGQYEYQLTPELILSYIKSTDDQSGWYSDDSPFGEPVAVASVCDNNALALPGYWKLIVNRQMENPSFAHAGHEFEFMNPARPGKIIKVTGHIVDIYKKRDRIYIVFESQSIDEDGREIVLARATVCWLEASDDSLGANTRAQQ